MLKRWRPTFVSLAAALLAVGCWQPQPADALLARRASPIRRVVNVLQMMIAKCEDRGDEEDRLFDEFACYCKKNKAELETSIEAARGKIPQLQSSEEDLVAEQKQLQQDIKKLVADRDAGTVAGNEATDMRESEKQTFQKESTDLRNNIDALEKAVAALEQADGEAGAASASAFLQSASFTWLQDFISSNEADRLNGQDRDILSSFLQQPDEGSASIGEIAGILHQLLENMQQDLQSTVSDEASKQSAYEALMAGKQQELRTLTAAIEQKETRSSTLTVQIAEVRHDLRDTSAGLHSDEKLAAELKKECDERKSAYSGVKQDLSNELLAIREVIKILTEADGGGLFERNLAGPPQPAPSFLQTRAGRHRHRHRRGGDRQAMSPEDAFQHGARLIRQVSARHAADVSTGTAHGAWNQLAARASQHLATKASQAQPDPGEGITKLLKLVDDMVSLLAKEQEDDDLKKQMCKAELDRETSHEGWLKEQISAKEAEEESVGSQMQAANRDIEALKQSITELDQSVADAARQRKEAHAHYVQVLAENHAAQEVLQRAKDRLTQYYTGSAEEKGAHVIKLIDTIQDDLIKENEKYKANEENDQKEYEHMVEVAADKRAVDVKAATARAGAHATLQMKSKFLDKKLKSHRVELTQTQAVIANLHKDCDWLLSKHQERATVRAAEIEALKRTKAVLNGADYEEPSVPSQVPAPSPAGSSAPAPAAEGSSASAPGADAIATAPAPAGSVYRQLTYGAHGCPSDAVIGTLEECEEAAHALGIHGLSDASDKCPGDGHACPQGCSVREPGIEYQGTQRDPRVFFNGGNEGSGREDLAPLCKMPADAAGGGVIDSTTAPISTSASSASEALAGIYEVWYEGSKRDTNMHIFCNDTVSQPGIFNDQLHFNDVAVRCSQARDQLATMYILNTHGAGKYECLRISGDSLIGSHYTGPDAYWGTVEYRLITSTDCSGILCTCTTPGGTAPNNGYSCTDGSNGHCGSTEACFATGTFAHGDWSNGCQAQPFTKIHENKDCQPSSDWQGSQSVESCAETTSQMGCSYFAHVTRGDGNCKCCNEGFTTTDDSAFDIYSVDKAIIVPQGDSAARPNTILKTVSGGDWTTVECPPDHKVLGGGCDANNNPWKMQYNGPDGDNKWKCGGHGGPKTVWAICSADITPSIQVVNGGDWTTADCPSGEKIIGGGCDASSEPWKMQYNGPDGDSRWKCGGHGGPKTVWAICSSQITPTIETVSGGDWTTVQCPSGKTVLGGGCDANDHPWKMQYDGPDGSSAWKCGGHGGPKTVWAICANADQDAAAAVNFMVSTSLALTPSPTPSPGPPAALASRDSLVLGSAAIASAPAPGGLVYQELSYGTNGCPSGTEISSAEECEQAVRALGIRGLSSTSERKRSDIPRWCSVREPGMVEYQNHQLTPRAHFNTDSAGHGREDLAPVCKAPGTTLAGTDSEGAAKRDEGETSPSPAPTPALVDPNTADSWSPLDDTTQAPVPSDNVDTSLAAPIPAPTPNSAPADTPPLPAPAAAGPTQAREEQAPVPSGNDDTSLAAPIPAPTPNSAPADASSVPAPAAAASTQAPLSGLPLLRAFSEGGDVAVNVLPTPEPMLATADSKPYQADNGQYRILAHGADGCPAGSEILTVDECQQAMTSLGITGLAGSDVQSVPHVPRWCSVRDPGGQPSDGADAMPRAFFNDGDDGAARQDLAPVCKAKPAQDAVVSFGLTIDGVDFRALSSDSELMDAMENALRKAVARSGKMLLDKDLDRIEVSLSQSSHSVRADVFVTVPGAAVLEGKVTEAQAAANKLSGLFAEAEKSGSLAETVRASVDSVVGISSVSLGSLGVGEVTAPSVTADSASAAMGNDAGPDAGPPLA